VRLRQVVADGLTVVLPADRLIDLTEPALAGTSAN
jgi:hypothetical protein